MLRATRCARRSRRCRLWAGWRSLRTPTAMSMASCSRSRVTRSRHASHAVSLKVNENATASALASYRAHAEGLPHGGRIERHVHEQDQLALISESTAVIETDDSYVVHPLSKALWLPAGGV